ncbi:MAG: NosD domain-containing protein [Candidatus Micrarchaeota archaeon]|nr:right-handed parallel beta-helix repeat-containing protein [Candidatus Micrarchaeota archaeon]
MIKMKKIILIGIVLLIFLAACIQQNSVTEVNNSNTNTNGNQTNEIQKKDCVSITDSMIFDESFNGKTIKLCEGIQNISQGILVIGNDMTIECDGTVIQGEEELEGIKITGNNNTIKNCIIQNFRYGLLLRGENNKITNNTLKNNFYGIALEYSYNTEITGNTVSGNSQQGILLKASGNNSIRNNTITGNAWGIWLDRAESNIIENNTITGNALDGIRLYNNSVNNNLSQNTITGNTTGIRMENPENNTIGNNTLQDNNTSTITGNNDIQE